MGKYMTRCSKEVGELAVMEVTQVVGVTTRARALALAAAAAANARGKRRKAASAPPDLVPTSSCLGIRSRRLVMTSQRERLPQKKYSAASSQAPTGEVVSRCSSNSSREVMVDEQEVEGLEISCNSEPGQMRRETTPSSAVRIEESDLESTAEAILSSKMANAMPAKAEIEEFFAAAEREQAQRFTDRYNYDVINDVPLDGRFEWARIE
ncbi:cyclin-dependent kinase inhibitor 1-like [Canna indica]|uniref:Cyclin-dependent kinase inhibitor n=1 Tax=Canna indica TaxID=4628 RepID=A0AAQ3JM42_9LILI|nr:cyclin-dependent kinase inhibitor 1-like [Canna indica]